MFFFLFLFDIYTIFSFQFFFFFSFKRWIVTLIFFIFIQIPFCFKYYWNNFLFFLATAFTLTTSFRISILKQNNTNWKNHDKQTNTNSFLDIFAKSIKLCIFLFLYLTVVILCCVIIRYSQISHYVSHNFCWLKHSCFIHVIHHFCKFIKFFG